MFIKNKSVPGLLRKVQYFLDNSRNMQASSGFERVGPECLKDM